MYRATDYLKSPIYTASGQWSGEFTISNPNYENDVVTCVADSPPAVPLQIPDVDAQDSWQTRNTWKDVLAALAKGDIQNIVKEKTKLEEAQRAMRKKEAAKGIKWEPKFFSSTEDDPVFRKLAAVTGWQLHAERTKGVWRFDQEKAEKTTKPYHGDITPFG
jgi:oxysterol-binding protein-related protein 9/10/11